MAKHLKKTRGVMNLLTKEECENVLSENKIYLKNQMLKKERISYSVYSLNTVTSLLERLIHEHFDNPQIDWLKNCMGEEAFNLIFSSQEEVNKWFDRMRWHVKKCDEYGRELDILKNNPPLKFEELTEGMWIWDNARKEWVKVEAQRETYTKIVECWVIGWALLKTYEFEPNRFYRKEVQG